MMEFRLMKAPEDVIMQSMRLGVAELRRLQATVNDGYICVTIARSPVGKDFQMIYSVAVEIFGLDGSPGSRLPTQQECDEVRERFAPRGVSFMSRKVVESPEGQHIEYVEVLPVRKLFPFDGPKPVPAEDIHDAAR